MNNDLLKLSLNQGKQFNTYQTKIKKNITKIGPTKRYSFNKKEGFVSLQEQEQIVRPSYDGYAPVLKNIQQTTTLTNNIQQKDIDELTQLQSRYSSLIQQYTDIQKKIGDSSLNKINRIGSNNPYLNKTIRFTTGHICYVTNEGLVKYIPSQEIMDSVNASKNYIDINIPWNDSYSIPGTQIPTNPPLISGTVVQKGQTLGNEGSNVYASKLVNNPNSAYIGCYNDVPPSTNVNVVPIMNSSNNVNGFISIASSVYLGSNNYGPWSAFDQNPNNWWHSEVSTPTNYNATTGLYEGNNGVNIVNYGRIGGEFLQINMPGVNTSSAQNINIIQYSLSPRLDSCCLTTRSPNSWYIIGLKDNQWYLVDRQKNQKFTSGNQQVYNVSSPGSYSAYMLLVDKVGNDDESTNRYCVQVAEWNLFMDSNSNDSSDIKAMTLNSDMSDYVSFDQCKQYAIENSYMYFGLQDYQDGKTKCLVSNDSARTQVYGSASAQTKVIPVWSSNTSTGEKNTFQLAGTGQITIIEPNGKLKTINDVVSGCQNWGTILINSATYGGNCKVPIGNVNSQVTGDLGCNFAGSCSIPISNQTFGDPAPGCSKSFDIDYTCGGKQFTKNLGKAEGQTMIIDCNQHMQENCVFFLILQDDGNMCVYKGKEPSDNKGGIWCTMTNGQQKSPNPDWAASKGKFGRNYLKSGEALGPDEWIGSNDGSIKLIMQSDGNLILYTSQPKAGCEVRNDINYGRIGVNAVYQLDPIGHKSTLGKIGYVDSESNLREYPDSMVGFTNDYQIYQNTDSAGNDITSLVTSDSNGCQIACNNNKDCAAYVYQGSSQTCWLKNRSAFPKGEKYHNNSVFLGVRQPGLKGSKTCSNKVSNIDTIQYDKYLKGALMTTDTQCNASIVSQEDQILYDNIKSQLITIGNDIASKMESLYNQDNMIFQKLNTSAQQFKTDLENYKLTNFKIKTELNLQTNNIEGMQNLNMNDLNGILSDSDLRVLQGNYTYIMWSILAVGILSVAINTMKK